MEQYIQPFVDTCINVFRDFAGLEISAGLPYFIQRHEKTDCDISSVIGLSGEAQGAVVLSMKSDLALMLAEILTSKKYTSIDDEDVLDAVGEIVNIISGNVKQSFEEMFKLIISLPTIIVGSQHNSFWSNTIDVRAISIPFTVKESHTLTLTVALST